MQKLSLDQFDYHLPSHLIAHQPRMKRDSSKLLWLSKQTDSISHHHFFTLPQILKKGDVLVRNNTKVLPARIMGQKTTGGKIEILLEKALDFGWNNWLCLTKPGIKQATEVVFKNSKLKALITTIDTQKPTAQTYLRSIHFYGLDDIKSALFSIGLTPVPPYIHSQQTEKELRETYQTTYAKKLGSVAAPTAGLHFTKELDNVLKLNGVQILELTLHVGLGTFLAVKTPDITKHFMHGERFELDAQTAHKLNLAKKNRKRIIAVGTTTVRVLEDSIDQNGVFQAKTGETQIYIYPPYQFKAIDGLITNFHLPQTTLLMLVAAFVSQPNTSHKFTEFQKCLAGKGYAEAIKNQYQFYSFGDSMLIL